MPTPYGSASSDKALNNIKPEIRKAGGYTAPAQGRVVAKLNQNENPYDIPASWKQEILGCMAGLAWGRYPDNQPRTLRERLARRFGVGADQIVLGHGSNQLLYLAFTAAVRPGDRVVLATPTFSLVETIAGHFQARLVPVMKSDDLTIPESRFLKAAAPARLVFLCSPDNPTGLEIRPDFLESVLQGTDGLVLWDEAYGEFGGQSAVPLIAEYPNLIVARTFSKAFGLAGLRIGALIAHPAVAAELSKANIPYNLDLFSIRVAERLLEETEWMEDTVRRIVDEREKLFAALKETGNVDPIPSRANFITFRVPDARTVLRRLEERGVLIRDMTGYPLLGNGLRVTVGTPGENQAFLNALEDCLS
ncbi:MAG TPA: histidinol-phosphate transaminase [bacterium]|nr:histidinol-phosphate transaminase [bacterium]